MGWTTRTAAALTVLAAFLLAPLFAPQVIEVTPPPAPARAASVAPRFDLPPGWSSILARHLGTRPLTIEVDDLQALLRSVESISARFRLDPLLVLAVIHVESSFNPYAISPAGSLGLMQLQVETARDVAARLEIPWTSDELLFDPHLNILLGSCYLRELLDRFRDPALALGAFHSGPSRIALDDRKLRPAAAAYAFRVQSVVEELQMRARGSRYS